MDLSGKQLLRITYIYKYFP